jgi:hypothetical protein
MYPTSYYIPLILSLGVLYYMYPLVQDPGVPKQKYMSDHLLGREPYESIDLHPRKTPKTRAIQQNVLH